MRFHASIICAFIEHYSNVQPVEIVVVRLLCDQRPLGLLELISGQSFLCRKSPVLKAVLVCIDDVKMPCYYDNFRELILHQWIQFLFFKFVVDHLLSVGLTQTFLLFTSPNQQTYWLCPNSLKWLPSLHNRKQTSWTEQLNKKN